MLWKDYFKFMAHLGPNFQINSGFVVLSLKSNLGYQVLVLRVNLEYWVLVFRVNLDYCVLVFRVNLGYRVLVGPREKFSRCPRWSLA